MAPSLDLTDLERRPVRYWHEDGVPELVMGLLWIVWGAAWLIGDALPRGGGWNTYWLLVPLLLTMSGVAAVWTTKRLKARLTFPRTGYVRWKEPSRGLRLMSAAVAAIAAAAAVVLITRGRASGFDQIATPGIGVILSLGFVGASFTQRAPHLLVLAGAALALGLLFGAAGTGWESLNWMFVILGASTSIMGAARLRMYLLRHPMEPRT